MRSLLGCRATMGSVGDLWQDIGYALRSFRNSLGFTVVAVLTLTIGIGLNTALFSVIDAVLLHPAPYPSPQELVVFWFGNEKPGGTEFPASAPDFLDWRRDNHSFSGMAAASYASANLSGSTEPERVAGARVSANLFRVLEVQPMMGRAFAEGDDQKDNRIVVLSYELWRRRFAGDPNILGKVITLDGEKRTIIGIMPAGFRYPWDQAPGVWRPLVFKPDDLRARGSHGFTVIGRLKAGVSLQQAQEDLSNIAALLAREYPGTNAGFRVRLVRLRDHMVRNVQLTLLTLLAAVAFILLIACANVAHLLLTRAAQRRQEIAIRAALGATAGRIVRQLLTESLLLAIFSVAGGLLLAFWGVNALRVMVPSSLRLPNMQAAHVNGAVLLFACGLAVVSSILFGLIPALQSARSDVRSALAESGRANTSGVASQRLRGMLVSTEIALSLMLLVGAGLLIESFRRLQSSDPGFHATGLLTLTVALPAGPYAQKPQQRRFYRGALERVESLPGVRAAAWVTSLPLQGHVEVDAFLIQGRPDTGRLEDRPLGDFRLVTPKYFAAVGIPLLRGRVFQNSDAESSPPVALIDEAAAQQYWPGENPIGARIAYFDDAGTPNRWLTIVGIVGSVKQGSLDSKIAPSVYVPLWQDSDFYMALVVRSSLPRSSLRKEVTEAIRAVDPDLPVANVQTIEELVADSAWRQRLAAELLGLFAATALLLAFIGTYGVISYAVTQRTSELGVRMALGATPADVLRLVLYDSVRLAAIGLAAGFIGISLLSSFLENLLYEVDILDVRVLTATILLIGTAVLLATWLPARRASRIDPIAALRNE